MTSAALENLARKVGSLKPETFSQSDFDGLLLSGRRRLADAQNDELNAAEYSGDFEVGEALLAAMIDVAKDVLRCCETLPKHEVAE